MADQAEMKNHIKGILGSGRMLEDLSAKKVREEVERKMGMQPGHLKSAKPMISALIDECLAEQEQGDSRCASAAAPAAGTVAGEAMAVEPAVAGAAGEEGASLAAPSSLTSAPTAAAASAPTHADVWMG